MSCGREDDGCKQAERRYNRALNIAMACLARRRHTEYELAMKLSQKGYEWGITSRILDVLRQRALLDDMDFAICYTERILHSRPRGRQALARELKLKGLSQEVIEHCLASISPQEEYGAALMLAQRLRERKGKGYTLANIAFALRSKGFAGSVVCSVCRCLEDSETVDKS